MPNCYMVIEVSGISAMFFAAQKGMSPWWPLKLHKNRNPMIHFIQIIAAHLKMKSTVPVIEIQVRSNELTKWQGIQLVVPEITTWWQALFYIQDHIFERINIGISLLTQVPSTYWYIHSHQWEFRLTPQYYVIRIYLWLSNQITSIKTNIIPIVLSKTVPPKARYIPVSIHATKKHSFPSIAWVIIDDILKCVLLQLKYLYLYWIEQ